MTKIVEIGVVRQPARVGRAKDRTYVAYVKSHRIVMWNTNKGRSLGELA